MKHPSPAADYMDRVNAALQKENLQLAGDGGGDGTNGLFTVLSTFWAAGEQGHEVRLRRSIADHMRCCQACRARVLQDEDEIFGERPGHEKDAASIINEHIR